MCLRAAIENLPSELYGIAREVYVQLPWGRLLEGIVRATPDVLGGIGALCGPARARRGHAQRRDLGGLDAPRYEDLPLPDPDYVRDVVGPGFARVGIVVAPARYLDGVTKRRRCRPPGRAGSAMADRTLGSYGSRVRPAEAVRQFSSSGESTGAVSTEVKASGQVASKRLHTPIMFRKHTDKATPLLIKALVHNEAITAQFSLRKR